MPKTDKELTVEGCVKELRVLAPDHQASIDAHAADTIIGFEGHREVRHHTELRLYPLKQLSPRKEPIKFLKFDGESLADCMAQARAWHKAQELNTILPEAQQ